MPAYNISRAHLHAEVEIIESRGERVTTVVPDGATFIVITEIVVNRKVGTVETRG